MRRRLSITLLLLAALPLTPVARGDEGTDNLSTGAAVYAARCGQCHNPRPAREFSDREWSVIVPHMRVNARLTGAEADALLEYLQAVNEPSADASARASTERPEAATAGADVFAPWGCRGCHEIGGSGGTVGPSLDGVVQRRGRETVLRKLHDPTFDNPASVMPKISATEKQLEAIVEALSRTAPVTSQGTTP